MNDGHKTSYADVRNVAGAQINPATEEKQTAIVDAIEAIPATDVSTLAKEAKQEKTLKDYILQEPDNYTTTNVTYLGKVKADGVANGTWLIVKIDSTGNFPTFRYANISNNPTLTTYALAWAARTTATYNYINLLTI